MKTAGIIGGISPESTIDYYKLILAAYAERRPDGSSPAIIINSIDLQILRGYFDRHEHKDAADYIATEIKRLAAAGCDFAAISANTPHIVFDEIQQQSPIPLISIVETTCRAAQAANLRRLGLLGTRFTMQARFYPEVFTRHGIELFVPNSAEQVSIHEKYFGELVKGIFLPETREQMLQVIARLKERHQTDGVILAGTELPLLLRDSSAPGIRFLDTTRIHVEAIVNEFLA